MSGPVKVDVLVVGSGAAGLSAAVTAAMHGGQFAIFTREGLPAFVLGHPRAAHQTIVQAFISPDVHYLIDHADLGKKEAD